MTIVSSFFTFPPISWWGRVVQADTLILDGCENFQKMSCRNRYRIAGANNSILLSVPLVSGRNQRVPMNEVRIHNGDLWQVQHWRTLVSAYKRAPFFEHYEESLASIFETPYTHLTQFNEAGLRWVMQQLKLPIEIEIARAYVQQYSPEITDMRTLPNAPALFPKYYQVFEDRIGFIPDLSILDLLFSEGPATKDWLVGNDKLLSA